ncbi:6107_t:CDS:2, partial [Entrophospora sp. SA101]
SCITADVFRNVRFLGTQFRRRILLQPTTNCLVHLVNYLQPPTHINTIPIYQLKVVKEWLDSIKIVYYEITPNLNWAQILRSINQDVEGFHKDCGWSFLDIYENDDDSEAKIDSDTDPGEASDESALDLDELEEGALNVRLSGRKSKVTFWLILIFGLVLPFQPLITFISLFLGWGEEEKEKDKEF